MKKEEKHKLEDIIKGIDPSYVAKHRAKEINDMRAYYLIKKFLSIFPPNPL